MSKFMKSPISGTARLASETASRETFTNVAATLVTVLATVAVTIIATLVSTPAAAFISGDLSIGKRSGSWETGGSKKSISSSTMELGVALDPIPLVPVSFGLRYITDTYSPTVADHGLKSLSSTAIVPEVSAWIPLGDLKPFARLGFTALGAYKGTAQTTVSGQTYTGDLVYKSTGPRIAAGLEWSLLPLVSLTFAGERSTETISITDGTVGGVDMTAGAKDIKFTNTAILVGAKVGL